MRARMAVVRPIEPRPLELLDPRLDVCEPADNARLRLRQVEVHEHVVIVREYHSVRTLWPVL